MAKDTDGPSVPGMHPAKLKALQDFTSAAVKHNFSPELHKAGVQAIMDWNPDGVPATSKKKGGSISKIEGNAAKQRLDRPRRKSGGSSDWMEGAVKHPGALHRELGVPAGKKIPEKKLEKAEHSSNPVERKRADLAETFKKERKG